MVTVAQLQKELSRLIDQGHGRKPVCIDASTFRHSLEGDGVVVLDVVAVTGPSWISMADDDGGASWNRDGTESGRNVVVLRGAAA